MFSNELTYTFVTFNIINQTYSSFDGLQLL